MKIRTILLALLLLSTLAQARVESQQDSFHYCLYLPLSDQPTCFSDLPEVLISKMVVGVRPGTPTNIILYTSKPAPLGESSHGPVIALNTPSDSYTPGSVVDVAMAVLNEKGEMVCDADPELTIMTPSGKVLTPPISMSPTCQLYGRTPEPDFSAKFTATEPGTYTLTLSAINLTFTKSMSVLPDLPFQVTRDAPTRVFPLITYPITITLSSTEGYTGTVTEHIPAGYKVTETDGEVTDDGIKWSVTIPPGSSTDLHYTLDAPDISPALHTIGPLSPVSKAYWHLALDKSPILDWGDIEIYKSSSEVLDSDGPAVCTSADMGDDSSDTCGATLYGGLSYRFEIGIKEGNSEDATVGQVDFRDVVAAGNALGSSPTITYCGWPGLGGEWGTCSVSTNDIVATGSQVVVKNALEYFVFVVTPSMDADDDSDATFFWDEAELSGIVSDTQIFTVDPGGTLLPSGEVKNQSTVYTTSRVMFNTTWAASNTLDTYIFSMDTGSGWTNGSVQDFVGSNSGNITYISTSYPATIYWKFYANDTYNIWNVSAQGSFDLSPPIALSSPLATPDHDLPTKSLNLSADVTHVTGGSIDVAWAQIFYFNGSEIGNTTLTNSTGIRIILSLRVNFTLLT